VAEGQDQVWGIDLTYVRLRAGWVHLVAVLDGYSRYVVSWEIDQTLDLPFVLRCVEQALQRLTPKIVNSDQGSHFTSEQYLEPLREGYESAWTVGGGPWTTSSPSGCGAA
jgi:putative transposase